MNETLYDQLSEVEDKHWWLVYRRALAAEFLKDTSSLKGDLLDIGCGTGGNTFYLHEAGFRASGMDLSEYAISIAKRKYPDCSFFEGDANNLLEYVKPSSCDVVTMFNVLYHEWIKDEADVLKKISKVLRPGGKLLITEPAFNFLMRKHDFQALTKHRYTLSVIRGLLAKSGFRMFKGTYVGSPFFFPAMCLSFIDRVKGIKQDTVSGHERTPELGMPGRTMNGFLLSVMQLEKVFIRLFGRMPFGVSLLMTAQKTG